MPLIIAPENVLLKIVKILTDVKTKKHLESLGITIDSNITVMQQSNGNIICKIKEGRLALDKNLATKIMVA